MKFEYNANIKRAIALSMAVAMTASQTSVIATAATQEKQDEDLLTQGIEVTETQGSQTDAPAGAEAEEAEAEEAEAEEEAEEAETTEEADTTEDAEEAEETEVPAETVAPEETATEEEVDQSENVEAPVEATKKEEVTVKNPEVTSTPVQEMPSTYSLDVPSAISLDEPSVIALTNVEVSAIADQTVTASKTLVIAPTPTVKVGTTTLKLNTDYTLSYPGLGNATDGYTLGENTVKITGVGLYAGSDAEATFDVYGNLSVATANATADATATVATNSYAYTGGVIQPVIESVTLGNTVIDASNFDVTYKNTSSTSVGTYTATITGKAGTDGDYLKNSLTYTYKIIARPMSSLDMYYKAPDATDYALVTEIPNQAYTASAQTPDIAFGMTYNGTTTMLVAGTTFTRAYSSNTAVGTAKLVSTAKGSNYSGSVTTNFSIVASSTNYFGGAGASTLATISEKTYTGTQYSANTFSPGLTATNGAKPTLGTGYLKYLALIPSTAQWDAEDLAEALAVDYVGVDADDKAEMEEALKNGGLPGTNTYLAVGIGNYVGSWVSQEVLIKSSLNLADINLYETSESDGTILSSAVWTGTEIVPGEISVTVAGTDLVEDTDYTLSWNGTGVADYGWAGYTTGTVTLTFTGIGAYSGTKTATYKVTALDINDDNIVWVEVDADGKAIGVGVEDQSYTGTDIIPEMELRVYYEGYVDGTTDVTDDDVEYYTLILGTDYTRSMTDRVNVGEASVTYTAKGSRITGSKRVENFDIVAATDNYFDGEDSECLATIADKTYTGTQITVASCSPGLTATNGSKPTLNTGYVKYLALIPSTASWSVEDLAVALGNDYEGVDADDKLEMEEALANGGLPGTNTYLAIGIANWAGSWASQEFTITASLTATTVDLWTEEAGDSDERTTPFTTAVWSGTEIVPGEIVVSLLGNDLVEDTDYEISWNGTGVADHGWAGYTTGTVTLTFTGIGAYSGTKTATYKVTALDINDDNIVWVEVDEDGDAIGVGVEDKEYTAKDIIPEMELRVYYNGYVDGITDVTDDDEEYYTLVLGSDYSRSMANRVNVGEATVTYTATGSRITGSKRTETFNIVAADENYFGGEDSEYLATIAAKSYTGTQVAVSSCSPGLTATNGSKPTLNTGYEKYLALIPATTTNSWGAEELAEALADDYAALTELDTDEADDTIAEMKSALANGGLPGTNTYLAVGIANWSGSWASQEFAVNADLSKATVIFFDDDQYTSEVTEYYPDEMSGDPTIKVVYGTKDATTGLYTFEVPDTWYETAFGDLTQTGAQKVTVTPADGATATSSRVGNFTIVGYNFNDVNAYLDITVEDQEFTGYTVGKLPDVAFALTTWDDYATSTVDLELNKDFTAELVNAVNVADKDDDVAPTIILKGMGDYSGTLELNYSITLPDDTDFAIEDVEKQKYTAGFVEPKPAVVSQLGGLDTNTLDLVEGVDFTYSYASNVHAGVDSATVTVTGMGNYVGITESATFSIAADCATSAEFVVELYDVGETTAKTSFDWNLGDQITPDLKVTVSGTEIDIDDDYTVEYGENKNLGTGTVTITPTDAVNYFGEKVVTFNIVPMDIDAAGFAIGETWNDTDEVGEIADKDFSGDYITIAAEDLIIFDEDGATVEGVTYTVSYDENLSVGTATVTATGTGNYQGTISTDFEITATATDLFDDAIVYGVGDQEFTGVEVEPVPTNITIKNPVTGGIIALVEGQDYEIGDSGNSIDEYADNVEPGVATMNIVGINSYAGNVLPYEFKIMADLSKAVVYYTNGTGLGSDSEATTGTYDWSGSDVAPTFDVYYNYGATGEFKVTYDATEADSMYTFTRDAESTDAGEKTINISPAKSDLGAFYTGTLRGTYEIEAIDVTTATKSDAGTPGDVTYSATDVVLPYTGLVQMPSHEDLELLFGAYELTEDDYTVTLKDGSDGIGTGLTDGGDAMTCVITGVGNFTGSFELAYLIAEADVDALLETAYLDTIAAQVFVGLPVAPPTKVWVKIDGVNTDVSEFFTFSYSTSAASNAARCVATGKTGTIYAGGKVETTFRLIGDLTKATMSFDTDDNGVIQVQLAFMDGDDELHRVPASAYKVSSATVNTTTSKITFKVAAITSQFYTGSLSGETSFGISMNTNGEFMLGDTNEDGILSDAEFSAVLEAYKSIYPEDLEFTDASHSYITYTNGVTMNSTGCAAFVFELADLVFGPGAGPDTADADDVGEFNQYVITRDQLRVGDYYHTGTHWGIFTEIGTNSYKTAEANVNSKVIYDREVTVADLTGDEVVFYSRYPYAK